MIEIGSLLFERRLEDKLFDVMLNGIGILLGDDVRREGVSSPKDLSQGFKIKQDMVSLNGLRNKIFYLFELTLGYVDQSDLPSLGFADGQVEVFSFLEKLTSYS